MPCGTHQFNWEIALDFFKEMECDDVLSASVKVGLDLVRNDDIYHLSFKCNGVIGIPCDRCLEEMTHTVCAEYSVSVKYGDQWLEGDDELTIPESCAKLNVAQMVVDTVLLTIPIAHSHENPSDCNQQMLAYLTDSEPQSENDAIDPRWAALQDIK